MSMKKHDRTTYRIVIIILLVSIAFATTAAITAEMDALRIIKQRDSAVDAFNECHDIADEAITQNEELYHLFFLAEPKKVGVRI